MPVPRLDKYRGECEQGLLHPMQNLFQIKEANQTKLDVDNITISTVCMVQPITCRLSHRGSVLSMGETLFLITSTGLLVVVPQPVRRHFISFWLADS